MYYLPFPADEANCRESGWEKLDAAAMARLDQVLPTPDADVPKLRGGEDPPGYRLPLTFFGKDVFLIALVLEVYADRDRVAYFLQHGTSRLMPLDGTSDPIHRLNEEVNLTLTTPEHAEEYIVFFCSFLQAEKGVFLLSRRYEDFDLYAPQYSFQRNVRLKRSSQWPTTSLGALLDSSVDVRGAPLLTERLPPEAVSESADISASRTRWLIDASVLVYGGHWFTAKFELSENGEVKMLDDTPRGSTSGIQLCFTRDGGLSSLSRDRTKCIGAKQFLDLVMHKDFDGTIEGLCIEGSVRFPPNRKLPFIKCRSVIFIGSIYLDDCHAADSIRFEQCWVGGSVFARRMHCDEGFSLEKTEIHALCRERVRGGDDSRLDYAIADELRAGYDQFGEPVGIWIESARIASDLNLLQVRCHATVRVDTVDIGATANLEGIRIAPLSAPEAAREERMPQARTGTRAIVGSSVRLHFCRATVHGSIRLTCATRYHTKLDFEDTGRERPMCFRPTVAGPVDFSGCDIEGSLYLAGLAIHAVGRDLSRDSDLRLENVEVAGGVYGNDPTRLQLPRTYVYGSVLFGFTKIAGAIDLRGMFVGGSLTLAATTASTLRLSGDSLQSRQQKPPELVPLDDWMTLAREQAEPLRAGSEGVWSVWRLFAAAGDVSIQQSALGSITADSARIHGRFVLDAGTQVGSVSAQPEWARPYSTKTTEMVAEVLYGLVNAPLEPRFGSVVVRTSQIKGILFLRNLRIEDGLRLEDAEIGSVCLQGSEITGAATINQDSRVGSLAIVCDPAARGSLNAPAPKRPRLRSLSIDTVTFRSDIRFDGLSVDKNVEILRTTCFGSCRLSTGNRTEVRRNVIINGTRITGDLDVTRVAVTGTIDLSGSHFNNVVAGAPIECEAGDVSFDPCRRRTITQRLDLEGMKARQLKIDGRSLVQRGPATEKEIEVLECDGQHETRTECRSFVLDSVVCEGDLRIWGVRAAEAISGREAAVAGEVSFYDEYAMRECLAGGKGQMFACMQEAEVAILADVSLSSVNGVTHAVSLARATLDQFCLLSPFPDNVSLRGISVRQWDPKGGVDEDATWDDKRELMLELLARTEDEPQTYLNVEEYFRTAGQVETADKVYFAMRSEIHRSAETGEGGAPDPRLRTRSLLRWAAAFLVVTLGLWVLSFATMDQPSPRVLPLFLTWMGLCLGVTAPWLLAWTNDPALSRKRPQPPRTVDAPFNASLSWKEKVVTWWNEMWRAADSSRKENQRAADWAGAVVAAALLSAVAVFPPFRVVAVIGALTFWVNLILAAAIAPFSWSMRRLIFHRLMLRGATGYGTKPHRMVLAWFLLLNVPLCIVLMNPENVEPTMPAQMLRKGAEPLPKTAWGWGLLQPPPTWAWMAIEASVPLIDLEASDKFEPSDTNVAIVGCDGRRGAFCTEIPFATTPKQIENLIRLLGYIFWPLAAAGLTASYFHRRESSRSSQA